MEGLLAETATRWVSSVARNVGRYAVFAIGVWFFLWVVLAPVLRGRKIREDKPPTRQLVTEFFISLRSVAIFATVGLSTFFLYRAGLMPGVDLAKSAGPVWWWVSLILMIVGHDAWFYWTHRLMHHPKRFRLFHRRHHLSQNPSPFTAYSFDLSEAVVNAAFVPLWLTLVPTYWTVTGVFMLHQIIRNTLGHSGYELMPARKDGTPMFDMFTTTTHHDLHHEQAGWNYGLYFTWWDRMMGTEHPAYYEKFAAAVRRPLRGAFGQKNPAQSGI